MKDDKGKATGGMSGPGAGPGAVIRGPVLALSEALEKAGEALRPARESGKMARAALAPLRWTVLLVQMEFLALTVPLLLVTGRLRVLHILGVWKTLRARLISYISVVAIASAVVIAFVPNPVMEGFLTQLKDKVRGTTGDILVETAAELPPDELVARATGRHPSQADDPIWAEIAAAAPRIEGFAVFSTGDEVDHVDYASVVGVDPSRETKVSDLSKYVTNAGGDLGAPFRMTPGKFRPLLRRRRALEILGREALGRLEAGPRWDEMVKIRDELPEPLCVRDEEVPALAEDYAHRYGVDAKTAKREILAEVRRARGAVEAELVRRLGETERRQMGGEAFARYAEGTPLPEGYAESEEAQELYRSYAGRPGLLVGTSLLEEHPDLHVGAQVELITGATAGARGSRTPAKGAKNLIAYIAGEFESGLYDFDVRTIYLDLGVAEAFFRGTGAIRVAALSLRDPGKVDAVRDRLERLMDEQFYEVGKPLVVSTWKQKKHVIMRAVNLQRQVLTVILFFAVFVAGFGILLSLRILVTEKVMDIGILMGIGASPLDVVIFYILAGLLLGAAGSLVGVLGGVLLVTFSNEIIAFFSDVIGVTDFEIYLRDVQHLKSIPVQYDFGTLGLIVLFTIGACYQFALYPALVASKLTPLDAVRRK
jgi:ABC-type lipoprotein release transport system permease subunit